MQYRNLGKSGLKVSALSFGSWVTFDDQVGEEVAAECMAAAFDAGVNFFDNAEGYASGRSETMMGNVVQKAGWKRSDLVISTKLFWGGDGPNDTGLSRKHLMEGAQASLERLQMDYVDLLFCHRPDAETPVEETVWAMTDLIESGRVFYWGTSEWRPEQLRQAHDVARREHLIPPTMEQPQYNMFVRKRVERDLLALYDDIGLGLTIWSPLASGILTGKHNDGVAGDSRAALEGYEWIGAMFESEQGKHQIEKVRQLTPIAEELGGTMAQLALAWCLRKPYVSTVITGASRPGQVTENMKALDVLDRYTPEVDQRVEEILDNHPGDPENFRPKA